MEKKIQISNISVFISCLSIAGFGFLASTWWLGEEPNVVLGTAFLVALWTLVFNFLPVVGWQCLKEPIVKYYFLPLSLISSVFYIYGIFKIYT